jgi:hypothetical protein
MFRENMKVYFAGSVGRFTSGSVENSPESAPDQKNLVLTKSWVKKNFSFDPVYVKMIS